MEITIQQLAKAAGTTSRTLRHYDSIGLVAPSRIGSNGYRYYDDRSLVRLQRVLLLRELGLGLDAIASVLAAQDAGALMGERPHDTEARVLSQHRELLLGERLRLEKQIASVDRTIAALRAKPSEAIDAGDNYTDSAEKGESLMTQNMFDGFDHTQYKDEVEERWGANTYAASDRWWRGLGKTGQQEWKQRASELSQDWSEAAARGEDPRSSTASDLARRHIEWLRGVGGTPASVPGGDLKGYVLGLADMYVADERFAANYGGVEGATFVRDALHHYVEMEF
ncbi:MAG: TipAS antibiotic-recognition domain-containing protein [Actinobacteria bacterium]|jgi:DNA-binding transcriptional MerR regulator|nr:TipAS antibiotic-recognition domain-containing protein [Actinomycetota bacterium]